ncbi:4Fe-4S dicluster domain-containing protein [Candidatus Bathyarchaeota archaeon]|nr:4Fe-4S dicluster domain-containing protein [Candidatus Bathyarchaeota archaeon]
MSPGKSGLYLTFRPENASFKAKIEELSGENIDLCMQCGGCSSGCPLTEEMDLLPSTVIRYVQWGMEEALDSKTPWVCITCFNCEVRCPRGIDVANVMEALRQATLRAKYDRFSLDELTPEELMELPQIAIISNQRKLSG